MRAYENCPLQFCPGCTVSRVAHESTFPWSMFHRCSSGSRPAKAARLKAHNLVCRSQRYYVTGDVRGVLLVMPESAYGVFRSRGPVRIRGRANRWIAHGREVKAQQPLFTQKCRS